MQPIVATSYLANGFEAHGKRILRAWRRQQLDEGAEQHLLYVQAGLDDLPVLRSTLPNSAMIQATERYVLAAVACDSMREQWMLSQTLTHRLGLVIG